MNRFLYKEGKLNVEFLFFAGLLAVMLLRCFYFGIDYFNYLDDNNTYGVFYRRNDDILNNIVLWYKLYTFRPIAFLLDAYVTQWFWPFMWVVLLFYTLMHFFTIYFFYKICDKLSLNFGSFGLLITAITPILLEAVYWIGASTRLVPGMFFSILSVYLLICYVKEKDEKRYLYAYGLFNLIATGFYEQIVVFNFVFTILVIIYLFKYLRKNRKFILSVPFISTFLIGFYYILFWSSGKQSSRGAVASGLLSHFISTAKSVLNILLRQSTLTMIDSFKGFFSVPFQFIQIIILLFVGVLSILVFFAIAKKDLFHKHKNQYGVRLLAGFILAAAPFAPFFILKDNYMSFRAIYPSIFGIALFLDTLLEMIMKEKSGLKAFLTAGIILPFFIINIVEINNYRIVEIADDLIIENLLQAFKETGKEEETPVILFNAKLIYAETSHSRYENVSSSDWALIGKANAVSEDYYFKVMFPVRNGMGFDSAHLEKDPALFAIDDAMNVFLLSYEDGILYTTDGQIYATIDLDEEGEAIFNLIESSI